MIIRSDFVSNSSSSSFIISDDLNVSRLKITKQDIIKAMCFLTGLNDDNYSDHFEVFDCSIEADRTSIDEHYKDTLNGFFSPRARVSRDDKGEILSWWFGNSEHDECKFDHFCEVLRDALNISYFWYEPNEELHLSTYDKSQDKFVDIDADNGIEKLIHSAYYKSGLVSNYELVSGGMCRFLIHMFDGSTHLPGDLYRDDERDDKWYKSSFDDIKYTTKSQTMERFNEILLKAIIKIKFNDELPEELKCSQLEFEDVIGGCFHEG